VQEANFWTRKSLTAKGISGMNKLGGVETNTGSAESTPTNGGGDRHLNLFLGECNNNIKVA